MHCIKLDEYFYALILSPFYKNKVWIKPAVHHQKSPLSLSDEELVLVIVHIGDMYPLFIPCYYYIYVEMECFYSRRVQKCKLSVAFSRFVQCANEEPTYPAF
ncbi:hypothetical protein CEXT_520911 [Caerostris extrusa]|uniref:Uncharacterized protein n=1 Tax=Caerostris extrusa TaxID=172846 RepID=A0AAV4RLU5_CAEEX|nr:hypothetical protein CEXT_520911 [Caerostris extrusa]